METTIKDQFTILNARIGAIVAVTNDAIQLTEDYKGMKDFDTRSAFIQLGEYVGLCADELMKIQEKLSELGEQVDQAMAEKEN